MKKVQDKLRNMSGIDLSHQIYIDGLNEHINAFVDSREFSYICAFTNIIKHRRLLDTSYRIEINSSGSILDLGFEMDGFSYKNQSYDRASCRDIVEVYKEKIIDSIFDVGSKINEYCSAIYSES